jgi:drug/metabolite transporter (DMT)-like permease
MVLQQHYKVKQAECDILSFNNRSTRHTLCLLVIVPLKPMIMKGWTIRLWPFFLVAVLNAIIPYLAISWGEENVPSSMTAILNATTPLVVVIVSNRWPGGERLTWPRFEGVLVGFLGVVLLIGSAVIANGWE